MVLRLTRYAGTCPGYENMAVEWVLGGLTWPRTASFKVPVVRLFANQDGQGTSLDQMSDTIVSSVLAQPSGRHHSVTPTLMASMRYMRAALNTE